MREIKTNIYTIEELEKLSKQAFEYALEQVSEYRAESFNDFYSREIVRSLEEAANQFNMKISDYEFGLWSSCYVSIDTEYYMDMTNEEKKEMVTWLNKNLEEGKAGSCPFTGVIYDCYFFDKVSEYVGNEGVTFNNLHKVVPYAIKEALREIIREEENTISDDGDNEQYAIEMELEFTENGEIYY